jgi:hypothetical protein
VRSALESVKDGAANGSRPTEPMDAEYVQLQVQGPAAALIISAIIALPYWAILVAYIVEQQANYRYAPPLPAGQITYAFSRPNIDIYGVPLVLVVSALALASVIIAGAVKLRRFKGYGFVIAAIILAMLPWSIHFLIGLPAGIWAIRTLKRPEVKAAFAANLRRNRRPTNEPAPHKETGPVLRKARSFWRSLYSVFLSSPRQEETAAPPSQSAPK